MDSMSRTEMDLESNSEPSSRASGSAKSLVKGIALVDLVAAAESPPRLVDLVGLSGLTRPTAIRLLDVLCRSDLLSVRSDGTYALGPRVAGWGHAFLETLDLPRAAEDLIQELVTISGETCYLGVLDRSSVLYVAAAHSPHAIRPAARVGSRMPLHSTGIGKVLLSALTSGQRRELLPPALERRTPNTITEWEALDAHLDRVREDGFAIDDIENEEGVRCVAAPIHDHTGTVVAALSVSAPAYRFSHEDVERLSHDALRITAQISARLGYVAPTDGGGSGEGDD
jgi:DNA-binding IclR family transcriptional regulator